ncbi:histone-lysine N-methyltransferase SETMAR [Trichonephila clavipes]|nr:histone-lysine N-methyltransferase SETMAR [Trichonephila clavipes]
MPPLKFAAPDRGPVCPALELPLLSDSGNASDELLSKNINQYFRQELIEKRNARMAHRVLQLLRQYPDESFFFAFGTGHFLGNGSVLDYVRDGGYEVEQVSPDAKIRNCQVIYSQFGLAIHRNDHQARRRFVEWAQNEIAVVPDFHKRILFSHEAHFWLNGYVNKQNCRIWSEANPQVYVETPLHPEKLTELWFQQDGATCPTVRATIDLLKDTFGDRLFSRFGPVNWPPRSCDLTPLDYFLWGYVKSLVYADKPQTLDHLEDNIRRVIADIRPQMLEKVIENWTSIDYIRASRGGPMPEIIFKM